MDYRFPRPHDFRDVPRQVCIFPMFCIHCTYVHEFARVAGWDRHDNVRDLLLVRSACVLWVGFSL